MDDRRPHRFRILSRRGRGGASRSAFVPQALHRARPCHLSGADRNTATLGGAAHSLASAGDPLSLAEGAQGGRGSGNALAPAWGRLRAGAAARRHSACGSRIPLRRRNRVHAPELRRPSADQRPLVCLHPGLGPVPDRLGRRLGLGAPQPPRPPRGRPGVSAAEPRHPAVAEQRRRLAAAPASDPLAAGDPRSGACDSGAPEVSVLHLRIARPMAAAHLGPDLRRGLQRRRRSDHHRSGMVHRSGIRLGHLARRPSPDHLRHRPCDRHPLELVVRRGRRLSDARSGRRLAGLSGAVDPDAEHASESGASALLALVPGPRRHHLWSAAAAHSARHLADRSAPGPDASDLHARPHPGALCQDADPAPGHGAGRLGARTRDAHSRRDGHPPQSLRSGGASDQAEAQCQPTAMARSADQDIRSTGSGHRDTFSGTHPAPDRDVRTRTGPT
ncbi:LigA [Imhoffiella purpurea]|uniref:LigA n=1 Tax=Imhoffiella purpurea TaxID=1249627 RepID=W9VHK8_9GAMM|nr:LigA [Imhoffiella purpurea]